nr:TetR/AcrR family transcriptional regulator [Chromobacterium sp. ASV5]
MDANEPPLSTRERLLAQGLLLAAAKGLRGLKVRELAAAAGVNPGGFVYHFGSREQFIAELVERWYAPLYASLEAAATADAGAPALQRLEATLLRLAEMLACHAGMVGHVLEDAQAGEPAARAFLLALPQRHPRLLLRLVERAQREGSLIAAPPLALLLFLAGAVGLPLMAVAGRLADSGWLPGEAAGLCRNWQRPEAVSMRLAWALRGIGTQGVNQGDG